MYSSLLKYIIYTNANKCSIIATNIQYKQQNTFIEKTVLLFMQYVITLKQQVHKHINDIKTVSVL